MVAGDERLEDWVGRTETVEDVVTRWPLEALAATLGLAPGDGDEVAPLRHWLFCKEAVARSALGPDGHPARGRFLPPVSLPRRMWAGGRLAFRERLRAGDAVRRESEIVSVAPKRGRSGDLVFVTVRHRVWGPRGLAVEEEQDIVYRGAPGPGEAVLPPDAPAGADWSLQFEPDEVTLFRYSALIFNGHRIHYDREYAAEEGYRGLVVQGPLTATLLLDLCRLRTGRGIAAYSFRAVSPLFAGEPVTLGGRAGADGACELWAANAGGQLAMTATATLA